MCDTNKKQDNKNYQERNCRGCKDFTRIYNKNLCFTCFNRTMKGFLQNKYRNMRNRSKKLGFKEIISREEFIEFSLNPGNWLLFLFNKWVLSDYKGNLVPSIDRINNDFGYVTGNIQYLTLSQNCKKATLDGVNRKAKPVKLIYEGETSYHLSRTDAGRFLGFSKSYLYMYIKKKRSYKNLVIIDIDFNEYKKNKVGCYV